jgi:hypothetical protein
MDEEREDLLAVDHDHGDALAVATLEFVVPGDVDLRQLEWLLDPYLVQHAARALAQMAALRREKRYLVRYG